MMKIRFRSKKKNVGEPTAAGRVGMSLFFTFFLLMGLLFTGFLAHEVYQTATTYTWAEHRARILSSFIDEQFGEEDPFVLKVEYTFQWEDGVYVSDKFSRSYSGSDNYAETLKLRDKYAEGKLVQVFVNPNNPKESVLKREPMWLGLFLIIPLIFVAIGAGGIWFCWQKGDGRALSKSKVTTSSASKRASPYLAVFGFLLLTVISGAAFFIWALPAFMKALESPNWRKASYEVISSRVGSHSSDDGTTYSVDIFYEYEINGAKLKSNRYDLIGGSSSGYQSKKAVVKQFPPGRQGICYVNPEDPLEAVLKPGAQPLHFLTIIPAVFFLVGIWGLLVIAPAQFRKQEKEKNRSHQKPENWNQGGREILETPSPFSKLAGTVLFTLVWNGFAGFLAWQAWKDYQQGDLNWALLIIAVVFGLVGIGAIVACFHAFLALFNPKVQLSVNSKNIPLGQTLDMEWAFKGSIDRLNRLKIHLEGREEAIYSQGTRTYTDKEVFLKQEMLDSRSPQDIATGKCRTKLPTETMHSFESGNNKIIWTLHFHAEIPRWPDVRNEYKMNLLPPLPSES